LDLTRELSPHERLSSARGESTWPDTTDDRPFRRISGKHHGGVAQLQQSGEERFVRGPCVAAQRRALTSERPMSAAKGSNSSKGRQHSGSIASAASATDQRLVVDDQDVAPGALGRPTSGNQLRDESGCLGRGNGPPERRLGDCAEEAPGIHEPAPFSSLLQARGERSQESAPPAAGIAEHQQVLAGPQADLDRTGVRAQTPSVTPSARLGRGSESAGTRAGSSLIGRIAGPPRRATLATSSASAPAAPEVSGAPSTRGRAICAQGTAGMST
jgi:hypothetical protein